jgi:hypothetical protein
MPVFDELVLIRSDDNKPKKNDVCSNNVSMNFNDENEEDLLPWERSKRLSKFIILKFS